MKTCISLCAALLAGAAAAPGYAQELARAGRVEPAPTGDPAPAAPRAPVVQADQAADPASARTAIPAPQEGIADIVVTATRREERLQQIPVAVTAITGNALLSSGITDTRLLTQAAPALNFSRIGFVGVPVIRGVGSSGVSNGDESNVATYIDGVYQADNWSTMTELVAVQRVEVLRGPQGTVFGRNATGGLINIITPDPSFTANGWVSAAYSRMRNDSNGVELRGYATGGLSQTVAVDLAGVYKGNDGYVRDLLRGGTIGRDKLINVRGNLLFQPSANAKLIFTAMYGQEHGQSIVYEILDGNTSGRRISPSTVILPTGPWQSSVDVLPFANYEKVELSLRSSIDLGAVRVETTGSFQRSHVAQGTDSDSSNISAVYSSPTFVTKAYSQELRLLSNGTGPFSWLAGAYAFHLTSQSIADQGAAVPPPGPLIFTTFLPYVTTTSYAGFAEGTFDFGSKLFLTVGGRFTTEKRSMRSTIQSKNLAGAVTRTTYLPFTEASNNRFTYRAALRYQVTPQTNIYGSYGTGFKSGVFNALTTVVNYVQPETIKAAEIGVKSDLAKFLRINLAAYHYDYTNLQASSRVPDGSYLLQNAARAKIYGGEAEMTVMPSRELSLVASAAYTHGRYQQFLNAQSFQPLPTGGNSVYASDASGKYLVRTPEWSFIFRPRYETALGGGMVELSGNIYHSTRVYYDFPNIFSQPPYTLVGAEIGFKQGPWRFSVGGTNLTNELVAEQIRTGTQATDRVLERPRRLTFTAQYKF